MVESGSPMAVSPGDRADAWASIERKFAEWREDPQTPANDPGVKKWGNRPHDVVDLFIARGWVERSATGDWSVPLRGMELWMQSPEFKE